MRQAVRHRSMPAFRSAQYVSATPPAPAAEKRMVAPKPASVISYDARVVRRRLIFSGPSPRPPSTLRNSAV